MAAPGATVTAPSNGSLGHVSTASYLTAPSAGTAAPGGPSPPTGMPGGMQGGIVGSMPGAMIPAMSASPLQVPGGGASGGMLLGAMTGPAVTSHMAAAPMLQAQGGPGASMTLPVGLQAQTGGGMGVPGGSTQVAPGSMPSPVFHTAGASHTQSVGGAGISTTAAAAAGNAGGGMMPSPYATVPSPQTHAHPPPPSSPMHIQASNQGSNVQSQVVCLGCRTLLLYPANAANVRCALCSTVTPVPPSGQEMAQLVCGGCRTLLMHVRGASSVQCSCCHTVNLAMETSQVAHINCGGCGMTLMYAGGAHSVKCAVCQFITPISLGTSHRPIHMPSSQPPNLRPPLHLQQSQQPQHMQPLHQQQQQLHQQQPQQQLMNGLPPHLSGPPPPLTPTVNSSNAPAMNGATAAAGLSPPASSGVLSLPMHHQHQLLQQQQQQQQGEAGGAGPLFLSHGSAITGAQSLLTTASASGNASNGPADAAGGSFDPPSQQLLQNPASLEDGGIKLPPLPLSVATEQ